MQTFSLFNINFEAFGTVVYKKESNYIRAWLGDAEITNRNFAINDITYTVPESGSTYIDFSDIVRAQSAGSVLIIVRVGTQTAVFSWDWVSQNGVSPYKNIIPPARMIVCGNLVDEVPVTINMVEDGFYIDATIFGHEEIQNNIPLQYFFNPDSSVQFQYRILDNNDDIFWQSRIHRNPCNCENMAYLEWESEVGTKKGWFFEILDTQKKTINSTSLQKITNDFDVRKGYELFFRLQTERC